MRNKALSINRFWCLMLHFIILGGGGRLHFKLERLGGARNDGCFFSIMGRRVSISPPFHKNFNSRRQRPIMKIVIKIEGTK